MEKICFILLMLVVAKCIISIFCISRQLKIISYIVELLFSGIIFYCLYNKNGNLYYSIVISEIEYIISKIIILLIVVMLKITSFKMLSSIIRKKFFAKVICKLFDKKTLCYKLKRWQKVDYGPRLKLGLVGMAKRRHRMSGIKFDRNGFPIFESFYTYHLAIKDWRKSREVHFSKANKHLYKKAIKSKKIRALFDSEELKELKKGRTPDKYTWHHHQKRGKLQLVLREVHSLVDHVGGYSIWGPKN